MESIKNLRDQIKEISIKLNDLETSNLFPEELSIVFLDALHLYFNLQREKIYGKFTDLFKKFHDSKDESERDFLKKELKYLYDIMFKRCKVSIALYHGFINQTDLKNVYSCIENNCQQKTKSPWRCWRSYKPMR